MFLNILVDNDNPQPIDIEYIIQMFKLNIQYRIDNQNVIHILHPKGFPICLYLYTLFGCVRVQIYLLKSVMIPLKSIIYTTENVINNSVIMLIIIIYSLP